MVTFQTFMTGLLAVSVLTTLTTQAVKKLIREFGSKAYANTLASIVSVVISGMLAVAYAIIQKVPVDASYVVCGIALAFLGWLCALLGYDKVKQAIKQIVSGGDIDNLNDTEDTEDEVGD